MIHQDHPVLLLLYLARPFGPMILKIRFRGEWVLVIHPGLPVQAIAPGVPADSTSLPVQTVDIPSVSPVSLTAKRESSSFPVWYAHAGAADVSGILDFTDLTTLGIPNHILGSKKWDHFVVLFSSKPSIASSNGSHKWGSCYTVLSITSSSSVALYRSSFVDEIFVKPRKDLRSHDPFCPSISSTVNY
ncbi:hypothetical protein Nepgr_015081 [Nepenthes gracilis]|uniref:Uncharacterized protein n=1 Tax=Nepenthes gracilis TaxID=150966 RepID=A0AAD3SM70_NEPGR|nr:hypothetical protein Nepgr_015081 [Nepenthes gracilis]